MSLLELQEQSIFFELFPKVMPKNLAYNLGPRKNLFSCSDKTKKKPILKS